MSQLATGDGQPGNWEEPGFFCVGLRPWGLKRKAGRSGMTGDCHVPICEGLGVRFPRATRPNLYSLQIISDCDIVLISQVKNFPTKVAFRDCIFVMRNPHFGWILGFGYTASICGWPIFFRFAQLLWNFANWRLPSLIHNILEFFPRFGEGTNPTKILAEKSVYLSWLICNIRIGFPPQATEDPSVWHKLIYTLFQFYHPMLPPKKGGVTCPHMSFTVKNVKNSLARSFLFPITTRKNTIAQSVNPKK